jgi:hypothetical protein
MPSSRGILTSSTRQVGLVLAGELDGLLAVARLGTTS